MNIVLVDHDQSCWEMKVHYIPCLPTTLHLNPLQGLRILPSGNTNDCYLAYGSNDTSERSGAQP